MTASIARLTWELVLSRRLARQRGARSATSRCRLQAYSESQLDAQLRETGRRRADCQSRSQRHALDFSGAPVFSLAALIPLILVLMTVTGAVYPAIDLTAGERERGTLEMLIAAPVPRVGPAVGKICRCAGRRAAHRAGESHGHGDHRRTARGSTSSLFGGAGLSLPVVIKVLLLLGLFAAFFSAVLLAITSCARSFKEAQAYIIPLMLLCLVPGVICLMPSLQFTGSLAVVPLVNIVLLARDLLEGSVDPLLAVGGGHVDDVLRASRRSASRRRFSAPTRSSTAARRPGPIFSAGPASRVPSSALPAAAFALGGDVPGLLRALGDARARRARFRSSSRLFVGAVITVLVFCGIPWAIAMFNRVRTTSGLGFARPQVGWLFARRRCLGFVLWPAAHESVLLNERLGIHCLRLDQIAEVQSPAGPVAAHLAGVDPARAGGRARRLRRVFLSRHAVFARCERSRRLGGRSSPPRCSLDCSTSSPDRCLRPSDSCRARSWDWSSVGSASGRERAPCMVLHAVHNGLLLSVVHWRDQLADAVSASKRRRICLRRGCSCAGSRHRCVATVLMVFATRPAGRDAAICARRVVTLAHP